MADKKYTNKIITRVNDAGKTVAVSPKVAHVTGKSGKPYVLHPGDVVLAPEGEFDHVKEITAAPDDAVVNYGAGKGVAAQATATIHTGRTLAK